MQALRQFDGKYRITLPFRIRREINVDLETLFKIEVKDGAVVLTPVAVVEKDSKE